MPKLTYVFHNDPKHRPKSPHLDSPKQPEPYVASEQLIQAVNLAIYLRRPLLLEGEAGCGKTRLARAVAHELGLPFYPWYVRSTSKAQDGLYSYDALRRLYDIQARQSEAQLASMITALTKQRQTSPDPRDPKNYREFGALGKAFRLEDQPAVVLIDEIDKADIDFPNDLLAVLDDPWEFRIPETNDERITAKHQPIVIITSNKERGNLPAPFLRRCIYSYVDFPDEQRLKEIVEAHYKQGNDAAPAPELINSAVQNFLALREGRHERNSGRRPHKQPGTSEFLDWLEALRGFGVSSFDASRLAKGDLPYPELLFKLRDDLPRSATAK
jgi:MoxR-like ATPase